MFQLAVVITLASIWRHSIETLFYVFTFPLRYSQKKKKIQTSTIYQSAADTEDIQETD